jgi:hypothetical protein
MTLGMLVVVAMVELYPQTLDFCGKMEERKLVAGRHPLVLENRHPPVVEARHPQVVADLVVE